ncbi:MAG: [citrate (pro-3S)-lyase] ligase [Lachnospiraceae bacterium]|nr:[citrate (pro-3S)-lyase] ligase [Candidatus Minthocola equi]
MSDYSISEIRPTDKRFIKQMDVLLEKEGISRDKNLDYSLGMFDDDYNLVATGSCFKNTLRCMAVDSSHQGEGLLGEIVSSLMDYQYSRGNTDLFLYTKCNSAKFFKDLGFYELSRVENRVVFMENSRDNFKDYLDELASVSPSGGKNGAIVMNANPFTLGHKYLIETAAAQCDHLHVFVVSEDASLVPADVRYKLVCEGTAHLPNVIIHKTGSYIISNATFPSYFLKDSELVIRSHAELDINIFAKIAKAAHINVRFVGEEPLSQVTGIYNEVMASLLPKNGVEVVIVPRLCEGKDVISASTVRSLIKSGDFDSLSRLVPDTTLAYFSSKEAAPVIKAIKASKEVRHY